MFNPARSCSNTLNYKTFRKFLFRFSLSLTSIILLIFQFLSPFGLIQPKEAFAYSTNMSASVVVGQADFTHGGRNQVAINGKGMDYVYGVATDGTHLFVSACDNNRVLIFNSLPTSNNATADVVIGQPDMNNGLANQGGTANANTLNCPSGIATDGTRLFIADGNNNRVLIFNTIPTTNNASANIVIGQPDMTTNSAGTTNQKFDCPESVSFDSSSGKLLVTEYGNNRVDIFNYVPVANNATIDTVVGQSDKNSGSSNQGGSVGANTLHGPLSARIINNKLFVADGENNRVLIFNSVPASDNASADIVIGQPDMNSGSENQGGTPDANTLNYPTDIISNGTKLFVQDDSNNRVLIFNSIPIADNASADVVLGQTDMVSSGTGTTAATMNDPEGFLAISGTKLFVGDSSNNRILVFNNYNTVSNGSDADVVVGQADFTHGLTNGEFINANGFHYPNGLTSDGTNLIVSDCSNNRVLVYNSIPTSNNASANVVIGQPDMYSSLSNQGGSVSANTLSCPGGVYTDGTKLFIADYSNHRVLIFNHIPTSNNASADIVIGQPDMTSNSVNQGGSVAATTLSSPQSVAYDSSSKKLVISDQSNNRVLIFNSVPTSNNASADVVVGQQDMASNSDNQGGSVAANTLDGPDCARIVKGKLLVCDISNSRVLIFNTIPTSNNASADIVIGQPDMTSNSVNQGGSVAANTLNFPADLYSDGTKIFIQDDNNNRIVVFNSIPTTNNASADIVIGQPDFISNSSNQGLSKPTASTINDPYGGIIVINNQLITSDSSNNRVLIYCDGACPSPLSPPSPSPGITILPNTGNSYRDFLMIFVPIVLLSVGFGTKRYYLYLRDRLILEIRSFLGEKRKSKPKEFW
jgi:hypothetical protein